MSFDDFIKKYPRYVNFNQHNSAERIFEFLSEARSIDRMIKVNDYAGLSALDGVVAELVEKFGQTEDFNLRDTPGSRQMVGAMVKFVLEPYGYCSSADNRVSVKNADCFSLSMKYIHDPQKQTQPLPQITGSCCGAKWHLLRYLGHHRNLLDKSILQSAGIDGSIQWMDFVMNPQKDGFDEPIAGMVFLQNSEILAKWQSFGASREGRQLWDGIGWVNTASGKELVLLEAKSRISELFSSCSAKGDDRIEIDASLVQVFTDIWSTTSTTGERLLDLKKSDQTDELGVGDENDQSLTLTIMRAFFLKRDGESPRKKSVVWTDVAENWLSRYYLYASRVTVLWFLNQNGIPARLVNVYFTGDMFLEGKLDCPQDQTEWMLELEKRNEALGLADSHKPFLSKIHDIFLPVAMTEKLPNQ